MATEQEKRAYVMAECDADLSFLFAENEVESGLQYRIVHGGYKSLRRFVGFEETRALFRATAKTTFAIGDTPADHLQLAILVSMWDMAREQLAREMQIRGESKALRQPRPMSQQECLVMRRVIERLHGKMGDHEVPAVSYLSDKLEELELNNPQAAPLDEVLSMDDVDEPNIQPAFDQAGRITVVRTKHKVKMPSGPEEFRLRLKVEAHLWLFLGAKYLNKPWLDGLTMGVWQRYTDYFLGKEVMLLEVENGIAESSTRSVGPDWMVLLSYEHRCRKHAFSVIRESSTPLCDALLQATENQQLKSLYFLSPLLLRTRVPKVPRPDAPDDPPRLGKRARRAAALAARGGKGGKGGKGDRKGSGKGGKGGDGKGGDLVSKTPDGRNICFSFNKPAGCPRGASCEMLHVCRKRGCYAEHSLVNHV